VHAYPSFIPRCQQLFHDDSVKPAQFACPEGETRRLQFRASASNSKSRFRLRPSN
jgi:hypothetical protein